jgi:ABC-type sugar transport system permease subunit
MAEERGGEVTVVTEVAGRARSRLPSPSLAVTLLLVIIWHLLLAAISAWALFNVVGAIWRLEAIPRTAIGFGSAISLVANIAAAFLLWRGVRVGRTISFTINYLGLVLAAIALFQSVDAAALIDEFATAFNRAFPPFIGVALAFAWLLLGRRTAARLSNDPEERIPAWFSRVVEFIRISGLAGLVIFGLIWAWSLDLPLLLTAVFNAFSGALGTNSLLLISIVIFLLAAKAIWAPRVATKFNESGARVEAQAGWLFLSPNLIGFLLFFAGPLVFSFFISFTQWNGFTTPVFVGFDNYLNTLGLSFAGSGSQLPPGYGELIGSPWGGVLGASDPLFWRSITNILFFMLLAVPLSVIPALILATLIQTGYRGTKVFRTIFFVPAVAGVIGVTLIWKQMLNSTVGFINWAIGSFLGVLNLILPGDPLPDRVEIGWLSNPSVALLAVVLVFAWSQFGFNTVLFTAGMQSIPRELHEAAQLDGAGAVRRFFSITIPTLRATTFFVIASTIILALQLFDIVYALNQPNPVGFPDNATLTPVVYLYQLGFQQDVFGRASAVAWVLFIVIFTLTLLQFRRQRRYAGET